jgi:nucleoside-diphosphate-sugar epimerase
MELTHELPSDDLAEIVNRTSSIASDLVNSKILITGSTGFIGSWLTNTLIMLDHSYDLGIELFLTSRNISKSEEKIKRLSKTKINFLEIDYFSQSNLPNIDVSHIIFSSTPSQRSTGGDNDSNVEKVSKNSFKSLVEVATAQKNAPIFCNLSSGAVYGKRVLNEGIAPEQTLPQEIPFFDLNNYARIKVEVELEVEKLTNSGQIVGSNPRLFAFSGPGLSLDAHFAIGNFMNNAINGEEIYIKGNPNTQRSYLYPTDLVVWIMNVLVKPTLNPIHIGSESLISISSLAEKISELFSSPGVSAGDDSAELSIYASETSKTRSFLNVSEEVSLKESLIRWKNWLSSQPRS